MIIRPATEIDADTIALLHAQSWRMAYRGMFRDAFLDGDVVQNRREVWCERFAAPKGNQMVLVAEDDAELCGFVCAYGNEDPVWGTYVDNLHVVNRRQRGGTGKRLMAEIARWSHENYPFAGIYLSVLEKNLPARRFYEALGAKNQESERWTPPGGGEVVALRYVWADAGGLLR